MYAQVGKEISKMVYKEMVFTEYTYDGTRFQWAHLCIGKGKAQMQVLIDYTSRVCTEEHFTLKMDGKNVITSQDFKDFDIVYAHVENNLVIFYTKGAGFNIAALQQHGKYMRW